MISTIISLVIFAYCAFIALIWLILFISLITTIISGKWEVLLGSDFGFFLYFTFAITFGLTLGIFIFGNLLNWMTEGQFAIQIFNPNKVGTIFLISSATFYIVGKLLINKKEEIKEEKLIEITEKEEIAIKNMVGGWFYWDRMNNKMKNQYIKEYRKTGKIKEIKN